MSLDINDSIQYIKSFILNPINGKTIQLIKYNININDVILHFDVASYPIKISTDFNKYCLAESVLDNLQLNIFNLIMVFKNNPIFNIFKKWCFCTGTDTGIIIININCD